ncbi:hypothetical protein LYSHEL_21780 [Lysobacter helvus]|uniref:AB hydrolase-1 domain-containing protein n=2 Tax=Lysobacteraceae TaxID=32033 RepID=A0ABM7Q6Y4_9GAMM|nr:MULTISPECIES: alpha/beta fold hydrolase [Lysobacter]BCT93155.1 hypothetical protein LYSCAS_21790 [Lysobacter caseinilyticus]BCT96307.1 hypothetical protein LYSHEL_21780 [Lysobacter helvus]
MLVRHAKLCSALVSSLVAVVTVLAADDAISAESFSPALRSDFRVTTRDGIGIHVREVHIGNPSRREPLILVHGARVPGIASFDLKVPGGSLAEELARRTGRVVYVMDARGYGGSDRPAAMSRPPKESLPLSRAYEVVRDIDAVVAAARERQGTDTVALFGWASGGMWAGYYASLHPEQGGAPDHVQCDLRWDDRTRNA